MVTYSILASEKTGNAEPRLDDVSHVSKLLIWIEPH